MAKIISLDVINYQSVPTDFIIVYCLKNFRSCGGHRSFRNETIALEVPIPWNSVSVLTRVFMASFFWGSRQSENWPSMFLAVKFSAPLNHWRLLETESQQEVACVWVKIGCPWMHNYIHTIHPYMHTIHPYMHTCIHPYIHASIHAYIHTSIHAYMHTPIHPYIHTCIHPYMHTSIHPYMHTCIHPYIHTSIHPYIHTSIHPYIHPSIHPYIHT